MAKFKEKKTVKYNIINTNITNKTQLILLQAFHFVKHVKLWQSQIRKKIWNIVRYLNYSVVKYSIIECI